MSHDTITFTWEGKCVDQFHISPKWVSEQPDPAIEHILTTEVATFANNSGFRRTRMSYVSFFFIIIFLILGGVFFGLFYADIHSIPVLVCLIVLYVLVLVFGILGTRKLNDPYFRMAKVFRYWDLNCNLSYPGWEANMSCWVNHRWVPDSKDPLV